MIMMVRRKAENITMHLNLLIMLLAENMEVDSDEESAANDDGSDDSNDESIDSIQDSDEEEFVLPDDLRNISNQEKRTLLRFRRRHTEREFEEELLRRTDMLSKKKDMERLRSIIKSDATATKSRDSSSSRTRTKVKV